ncbi:LptM family lipoprotein [Lachnoclostridium sp. Marseille-P6806]|uniref:LptM family lipoprotein n=1 Tax=Lachnoclostridium sp. Marseille-P6806 TaxID=2364793 RepID=UPI00103063F8|nr:hypothetical protein [Lachnoclostridium sp. Marseille-P6806]
MSEAERRTRAARAVVGAMRMLAAAGAVFMLAACGQSGEAAMPGEAPAGGTMEEVSVRMEENGDLPETGGVPLSNKVRGVRGEPENPSHRRLSRTEEEGAQAGGDAAEKKIRHIQLLLTEQSFFKREGEGDWLPAVSALVPELPAEEAERYPALADALSAYGRAARAAAERELEELTASYAAAGGASGGEGGTPSFLCETTGALMRADTAAVSLLLRTDRYTGGAAREFSFYGVNFDAETGKRLSLSDVIADPERFAELLDEHFRESCPETERDTELPGEAFPASGGDSDDGAWTIDAEGVNYYFRKEASGASGAEEWQTVSVRFDEAPELFSLKYREAPDAYVLPLFPGPRFVDADGDGTREEVSVVWEKNDEEDSFYDWVIHAGSRTLRIQDWCYSEESYLVRSDGRYYLYLFELSDNDHTVLGVIDLARMNCDVGKKTNAFFPEQGHGREDAREISLFYSTRSAFGNPRSFELGSTIHLLGTYTGIRTCHVGSDGWPEADSRGFRIGEEVILRTKKAVSCRLTDESGAVLKKGILPENCYFRLIRTDGEHWVDMQEVDGGAVTESGEEYGTDQAAPLLPAPDYSRPVYRIYENRSDWPYRIGGDEEGNLFDGIHYAG